MTLYNYTETGWLSGLPSMIRHHMLSKAYPWPPILTSKKKAMPGYKINASIAILII